ncbi:hypothetical protein [Mucilaginibacter sp.]|uniref:hypothetical protein n=1 Tax=Mucilaginibacter sp. TaxID=1882438 RepID=UPI0035BBA517
MKHFPRLLKIAVLSTMIVTASCKKNSDGHEYPEGTKVNFSGAIRPGCVVPITIIGVSYRSPKELKYFAKDMKGVMMNDLSEFEIKPW